MSDWTGMDPLSAADVAGTWTKMGVHAYQAFLRRLLAFDDDDRPAPLRITAGPQAAATITIEDLRAAMDACRSGPRPMIEVSQREWDALVGVEPRDWPRLFGLPTDLGGVQVVVVDIADVRRRQAEMDDLLD